MTVKTVVDRAIQSAINRQAEQCAPCIADRLAISLAGKSEAELLGALKTVAAEGGPIGYIALDWLRGRSPETKRAACDRSPKDQL